MMLAFYANWGTDEQARSVHVAIRENYVGWPEMNHRPPKQGKAEPYYPRHAAHVLFGMALAAH